MSNYALLTWHRLPAIHSICQSLTPMTACALIARALSTLSVTALLLLLLALPLRCVALHCITPITPLHATQQHCRWSHPLVAASTCLIDLDIGWIHMVLLLNLELLKALFGAGRLGHFQHVEADSLAQGTALAHCDPVTHRYVSTSKQSFVNKCFKQSLQNGTESTQ